MRTLGYLGSVDSGESSEEAFSSSYSRAKRRGRRQTGSGTPNPNRQRTGYNITISNGRAQCTTPDTCSRHFLHCVFTLLHAELFEEVK